MLWPVSDRATRREIFHTGMGACGRAHRSPTACVITHCLGASDARP